MKFEWGTYNVHVHLRTQALTSDMVTCGVGAGVGSGAKNADVHLHTQALSSAPNHHRNPKSESCM